MQRLRACPGASQELEILHQSSLLTLLEPGECVVASADFPVCPGVVTTKNFDALLRGGGRDHREAEAEAVRRNLKNLRQSGRRTMEVLKSFKCLTENWRYELDQHGVVFMVCLQLTNLIIMSQVRTDDDKDENLIE